MRYGMTGLRLPSYVLKLYPHHPRETTAIKSPAASEGPVIRSPLAEYRKIPAKTSAPMIPNSVRRFLFTVRVVSAVHDFAG